MRVVLVEHEGSGAYLKSDSAQGSLRTEEDVMDLIAAAWEHGVTKLMLEEEALSDEFFQLRSGVAGVALQKFVNYQIRTAAVISNEAAIRGRAKEMVTELNKGGIFRVFPSMAEAEAWLLAD
jgi:PadR family transcriptional regulator, regulatory protein AphA